MKKTIPGLSEFLFKTSWAIFLLAAAQGANASLLHRYSFGGANGDTVITDSVGGANGTLMNGNGSSGLNGSGQLVLDGNSSSTWVALPSGITPQLTNATFETWVTQQTAQTWAELWTFGTNNGSSGQGDFLSMIPVDGGVSGQIGLDNHSEVVAGGPMPTGQAVCVTVVYDFTGGTETVYVNGTKTGSGTVTIPLYNITDTQSYIGQSQWYGSGDSYFAGTLDEFRIYSSALAPGQVEADYEAGVDVLNATPGNLTGIRLASTTNTFTGLTFPPVLMGAYSALTNEVDITSFSGISYSSDNTNIVAYGTDGKFHAVGVGTTSIRAAYQSLSASVVVSVVPQSTSVLVHRYSFNGAEGSTAITDSVGTANGTLMNGSATAELNGSGQLVLDGNSSSGWVSLPSGIMPKLTNTTIEIWVTEQIAQTWAELWTFGHNDGAAGQGPLLSMIPVDGGVSGQVGLDNHSQVVAGKVLPLNQTVCLTAVYNYLAGTAAIYQNGIKMGSGSVNVALYTMTDDCNYIGQSQWHGSGDPYFAGTIDEFRIYSGVQSDLQLAIDTAAGPNNIVTNTGGLQSVVVQAASTNLEAQGVGVPVQVLANFANIANVPVTGLAQTTFSSSDKSVGVVVNGVFLPQNAGVVTITASYGGFASTITFLVTDTNQWPSLLHRWRFNRPAGSTTVTDVVAGANATVYGPAIFDGQKMITATNNPASNSGGNGMPAANGVWAAFPANQGIVSGLPNEASFEIWVKWFGGNVWQEAFDFGQAATPGVSSGGGQYLMISPKDGGSQVLRAEWNQSGNDVVITGPTAIPIGQLCQIVWTHDQDRQVDRLYLNGQLVGSAANTGLWAAIPDTDNWLARDEWPDAMFSGEYWDFRIWNGALTGGQVANLYSAGPAVIVGPGLQITTTPGHVTLKWPANATGFSLWSATNLAGAWTSVAGTPTVVNGVNTLTLPTTGVATFYRLKQ